MSHALWCDFLIRTSPHFYLKMLGATMSVSVVCLPVWTWARTRPFSPCGLSMNPSWVCVPGRGVEVSRFCLVFRICYTLHSRNPVLLYFHCLLRPAPILLLVVDQSHRRLGSASVCERLL